MLLDRRRRRAVPLLGAALAASMVATGAQGWRAVLGRIGSPARTGVSHASTLLVTPDLTASMPAAASETQPPAPTAASTRLGVHCTGPGTEPGRAAVARLQQAISAARAQAEGRTAVRVVDAMGRISCGANDLDHFDSASIIKATTVATMLWRADTEGRDLTDTEQDLARLSITLSDNDAQSALWTRVGGAAGVQAFLTAAGMRHTVPDPGAEWGLSQVTAADQAVLLRAITSPGLLSAQSRAYLLALMRQVSAAQRWGVPAAAGEGSRVAVKNGWLPIEGGWVINSIGYVSGAEQRFTLVILSDGNTTMASGVSTVEGIAAGIGAALQ